MLSSEMNHFLTYCKVSGFSDKSIETLTLRLKDFYEYLKSVFVFKPEDISYHHLKEFTTLRGKTSVHVKKAKVWTLHQFFHFLQLNGRVSENIALQIPYPKIEKTVPKFLTIEEFNRLLEYFYLNAQDEAGLRNLIIMMMLGMMGLRLSSVIALNTDDIDLHSGVIWVLEKGQQERSLIIPKVLCLILDQYLSYRTTIFEPLFLSARNKRISEYAIRKIFRETSGELGIDKHLHAHLFRHTAATHLNKVAGTTITQHVLGHNCRNNTYNYTHLNPDRYAVYMTRHPYMKKEDQHGSIN